MDSKLYMAAKHGYWRLLVDGTLISRNREHGLMSRTHQGNNIVHIAARYGHKSFIWIALYYCSDLINQVNSGGDTPLHVAAKFGQSIVVEAFLGHYNYVISLSNHQQNHNNNRRMSDQGLPEDVLRLLLQERNLEGNTALHEALRNGHESLSLFLLELDPQMASCVNIAGESLLYLAAESRCDRVMEKILCSEKPYSVQGPHGQNALHAAKFCTEKTIDILLSKSPELAKQVDERGNTVLHYAIQANYWWLMAWILRADPSVACLPDTDGMTPFLRASTMGMWRTCQHIIAYCPESIESCDKNGRNVVHLFKSRFYDGVKKFLAIPEMKEIINQRDAEGNTPLHLAIKDHDYGKAKLILRVDDVDVNVVNKVGLTALDICESDWKVSFEQRMMWYHLRAYQAHCGRNPNQFYIPIGGPKTMYIGPDADWKQMANTISLVATLLATVTFTAAFTMPGGYNSNDKNNMGGAVLIKKAAFKAFILSDAFALCCSLTVVFVLIWAMLAEPKLLRSLTVIGLKWLKFALYGTVVAFITGLYAVIASDALWVAVLVCIMASIVPIAVINNTVMMWATGIIPFALIKYPHLRGTKIWHILEPPELREDIYRVRRYPSYLGKWTGLLFKYYFGQIEVLED